MNIKSIWFVESLTLSESWRYPGGEWRSGFPSCGNPAGKAGSTWLGNRFWLRSSDINYEILLSWCLSDTSWMMFDVRFVWSYFVRDQVKFLLGPTKLSQISGAQTQRVDTFDIFRSSVHSRSFQNQEPTWTNNGPSQCGTMMVPTQVAAFVYAWVANILGHLGLQYCLQRHHPCRGQDPTVSEPAPWLWQWSSVRESSGSWHVACCDMLCT